MGSALVSVLILAALMMTKSAACAAESRTGAIEGQVLTLFGDPVPDAKVEVVGKSAPPLSARTDGQGSYHFSGLAQGDYRISVAARAFGREERAVFLRAAEDLRLNFGLVVAKIFDMDPCEVNGVVRDATGKTLGGATVVAMAALNSRLFATTQSDEKGRYVLRVPDPGHYVVYAYKASFSVGAQSVTLSADISRPKANADFQLVRLAR